MDTETKLTKLQQRLVDERYEAKRKALDSLARYKFFMFGYWAAQWVSLNRLCAEPDPNPFKDLVAAARIIREVNPIDKVLQLLGLPKGNVAYPTCEQPIPEPTLWLSLSPAIEKALTPCGFCAAEIAHLARGNAA